MTHPLEPGWSPEDDFRRYYPAHYERIARLPFADLAQHVHDIEREMRDGESIEVTVARDLRSEATLTVRFPGGSAMHYMLVKDMGLPPDWRPTGFTPS
jgi:hypothetical protein